MLAEDTDDDVTAALLPHYDDDTNKARYGSISPPDGAVGAANEAHTLSVADVCYDVKEHVGAWYTGSVFKRRRTKSVLRNVSAHFRSGEITAILGNSGSGKTSLLDIISNRVPSNGTVTGNVYFNNRPRTQDMVGKMSSYVMQADRFLVNLTVNETLTYIAQLKFNSVVTNEYIQNRVRGAIHEMGLRHIADSRIGGFVVRGISGGERRRVTIAMHLLQDPRFLLLDEPTTGLDSFNAHSLILSLANLAHKENKIIVLSIHQPRSDIYSLFDHIGIMSLGEMVYFGPRDQLVPYFTSIGHPCPKYANPLDHYVDVSSIDRRTQELEALSCQRLCSVLSAYCNSQICQKMQDAINEATGRPATPYSFLAALQNSWSSPGLFYMWYTLFRRMNVNLSRDRSGFAMRLFQLFLFSIFLIAFVGRLKTTEKSIQDRQGMIYEAVSVPPFVGMLNGIAMFPTLRDLYYRESRDNLYSTAPFLLAYYLQLIPFTIFSGIIFSCMVYWGIGLQSNFYSFLMFTGVCSLLQYTGEILSVILLALIFNPQVCNSLASLILTASLLVASGILRSLQNMLGFFETLSWGSVHKYSTEIVVANEFKNLDIQCPPNTTCIDGNAYLQLYFPEATDNIGRNFAVLGGITAGLMLVGWAAFKVKGVRALN